MPLCIVDLLDLTLLIFNFPVPVAKVKELYSGNTFTGYVAVLLFGLKPLFHQQVKFRVCFLVFVNR